MLKIAQLTKFYDQVKQEVRKVTWPTRKEVLTSTGVVVLTVIVFSLVCLLVDYGIHSFVQMILNIGK